MTFRNANQHLATIRIKGVAGDDPDDGFHSLDVAALLAVGWSEQDCCYAKEQLFSEFPSSMCLASRFGIPPQMSVTRIASLNVILIDQTVTRNRSPPIRRTRRVGNDQGTNVPRSPVIRSPH